MPEKFNEIKLNIIKDGDKDGELRDGELLSVIRDRYKNDVPTTADTSKKEKKNA